jgi:hypothetical protein
MRACIPIASSPFIMSLRSFARLLACSLALCCSAAVLAQAIPVPHYDEEVKPDAEAPPFPAAPTKANLLRFPTDWGTNEVYIDTASLVFGDNMVSYTLVVRGAGGADNVTFESLRCGGERRVLAYGKRDGTWSAARGSDWLPLRDARSNRYYYEFWKDVFCLDGILQPKRDVLADIKRGGRERSYAIPTD